MFCDRLGWNNLELLIGQFQSRLEFGIQRELVDLCRLVSVDGARARILHDAGILSVALLAAARTGDVEQILHTNTAFTSSTDTADSADTRRKVKNIFIAGLPPMTESECAARMVAEARAVMKRDLGVNEAAWSNDTQTSPVAASNTSKRSYPIITTGSSSKRSRRKSSPKLSPHLKFQLQDNKPKNLTQVLQRSIVSPESKEPSIRIVHQCASPALKQDENTPATNVSINNAVEDFKETTREIHDNTQDLFDVSGMSDTFDMSSVVENIFLNEAETAAPVEVESSSKSSSVTKKKRVSWGDENGVLCVEKEITPLNSQISDGDCASTPAKAESTSQFNPKTPKFKVCSEELDLHWSGSESDASVIADDDKPSDDVFAEENLGGVDGGNESSDVFGDTISDSILARAMDQPRTQGLEVSAGMLMAAEGLDSDTNFSLPVSSSKEAKISKSRRKRRKRKQLDKASVNMSSNIMSDSDSDTEVHSADADQAVEFEEENDDEKFCVVDVCTNQDIFQKFASEWKSVESFSLAVGVSRCADSSPAQSPLLLDNGMVMGVAVSWTPLTSFYISLHQDTETLDDSLGAPEEDKAVSLEDKLALLGSVLSRDSVAMSAMEWRKQASILYQVTGRAAATCRASDPSVAAWLLDPASAPPTLSGLVLDHAPALAPLLPTLGSSPGYGSVAASPAAPQPARYRAVAEAALVRALDSRLGTLLRTQQLAEHYSGVEMRCQQILLLMELAGMGLNEREYEDTKLLLEARLRIIEEVSYRLAGRHFSLSSPPDVCKVLYRELRLPVNGDPKINLKNVHNGKGGIRLSAAKEILEKLIASGHSQLPALVLEHRRLSSALSKTVSGVLAAARPHPVLQQPRVYPVSITHTATGRVALQEPNLQNIPKDFQVEMTDDLKKRALGRRSSRRRGNSSSLTLTGPLARLLSPPSPTTTVSLRLAITPAQGNLLVSADYSQLELRILAHLSGDAVLINTLSSGGDVFRAMAAEINNSEPKSVTDEMRQQAKQIVYGVIYGIGDKSLAEQLGVDTMEAVRFMDKFKTKYSGVRSFLHECVVQARRTGHVETLSGRRRRLEDINHSNAARRSAAERQAVNTRVQGSAADLVKTAMVNIDTRIRDCWPQCRPLKWVEARSAGGCRWPEAETRGAWLVLQLHDELMYEVSGEEVVRAAAVVKRGMEAAMALAVPTPVRVKVGANWGELQDFHSSTEDT